MSLQPLEGSIEALDASRNRLQYGDRTMRRTELLLLLAVGNLWAQTPRQFESLLTDSNDYVCGGIAYPDCATWPMPPIPMPGAGYRDPVWGTTVYRLAVPHENTAGTVIPAYSRVQAWNSDGTLMTVVDMGNSGLDLYDATTVPPTPINRITTTDGSTTYPNAISGDALWAYTDPHRIYYQASSQSSHGTELRYVDVSTCRKSNCALKPVTVHTFSCRTDSISNPELGPGVAANKIETGSGAQGGMFDNTDRYFSFTCDKVDGTGRHVIDFIRYDRQTDTVVHQDKWYKLCPGHLPQGCAAYWYTGQQGRNIIRMNQHPDHRYITVLWQTSSTNGKSGTTSNPTHINITNNVLTVTANNTLQLGTEAKFHNLSAATYLNNRFVLVTRATSTQFTANFDHPNDDQAISSGTITGLQCTLDVNWVRGCGTEVFDDDYNYLGPASSYLAHQDTGFDVNGVPVYVEVQAYRGDRKSYRSIQITDLTKLDPTRITSKRVLLPCSYSYLGTDCDIGVFLSPNKDNGHVSMQGSGGPLRGYALFSTFSQAGPREGIDMRYPPGTTLGTDVANPGTATVTPASMTQIGAGVTSIIGFSTPNAEVVTWKSTTATTATATFVKTHYAGDMVTCLSCSDTGFAAMELFVVKIDTTATDSSNAVFWRIGRTHAIRNGDYNCEAHATVNRDFSQILFGSSWDRDCATNSAVTGYWMKLP
jgi:hypothetical protein